MISVIIPTYNEALQIKGTIRRLLEYDEDNLIYEIIVADGGSTDETLRQALTEGVTVMMSPRKGRAAQMNYGALHAKGEILYFLHADTIPPKRFTDDIFKATKAGYAAGCYRLSFDLDHWFLKANCWFTRFDLNAFRYGDQSLYVVQETFKRSGGFSEQHIVMEDYDLIKRIRNSCHFHIMKKPVVTSARKYKENGIFKTQAIFFLIFFMYQLGFPQAKLLATYRRLIRQDKL